MFSDRSLPPPSPPGNKDLVVFVGMGFGRILSWTVAKNKKTKKKTIELMSSFRFETLRSDNQANMGGKSLGGFHCLKTYLVNLNVVDL